LNTVRLVTAKNLLLDLLRTSTSNAWPVKKLIEIAGMFDISENAVRVNLSRLVSRGLIETDSRGFYLMTRRYDPLRNWIDDWTRGEQRVTDWNDHWLCVTPPPAIKKKDWLALDKSLLRFGFRPIETRMWVRPDNLSRSIDSVNELINAVSGISDLIFTKIVELTINSQKLELETLWDRAALEEQYSRYTQRLTTSMQRLENADHSTALAESFILGGEVIHLLALDPLLPASMINTELRIDLTQAMLAYDAHFHQIWRITLYSETVDRVPGDSEPHAPMAIDTYTSN
jgi:phenylacetic acid degradation operon negative regulatory protein